MGRTAMANPCTWGWQSSQAAPRRGGQGSRDLPPLLMHCVVSQRHAPLALPNHPTGPPHMRCPMSPSHLSITFSLSGCSSLHLLTPLDDHMAPSHFLHFITVSSMDHFMPPRPPNFCCVAEGLLELTSRLAGSPPFLTCTFSPNTSFSFCCFSSCWLRISYLGNVFCEKPR